MLKLMKVVPKAEPNAEGTWVRLPDSLNLGRSWTDHVRAVEPWVPDGHLVCKLEDHGVEHDVAWYESWMHRLLRDLAWPWYDCERCVGQEDWQGCECAHRGAVAPGVGPEAWRLWVQRLWSVVARRCGTHDPGRR